MAAWFWHIIAIMFLIPAIVFLILDETLWMFAFFMVVSGCEFMAWRRQNELKQLEKE